MNSKLDGCGDEKSSVTKKNFQLDSFSYLLLGFGMIQSGRW